MKDKKSNPREKSLDELDDETTFIEESGETIIHLVDEVDIDDLEDADEKTRATETLKVKSLDLAEIINEKTSTDLRISRPSAKTKEDSKRPAKIKVRKSESASKNNKTEFKEIDGNLFEEIPKSGHYEYKVEGPKIIGRFDIDLIRAYLSRLLAFIFFMLIIETVQHALGYFDSETFQFGQNFKSLFYPTLTVKSITLRTLAYLTVVYIITPKTKVYLYRKGIVLDSSNLLGLLYVSKEKFVPWADVTFISIKNTIFEPFLNFYDKNHKLLGRHTLLIKNRKKFANLISQLITAADD